jgi:hypothetical protein
MATTERDIDPRPISRYAQKRCVLIGVYRIILGSRQIEDEYSFKHTHRRQGDFELQKLHFVCGIRLDSRFRLSSLQSDQVGIPTFDLMSLKRDP